MTDAAMWQRGASVVVSPWAMPHANELTIARALEIIGAAGPMGMSIKDFGSRWPQRKNAKGSLVGISTFLSRLAQQGYVVRSGRRRLARVAITRAGRDFFARWQADFLAQQEAEPW
jgi:hypothetical protein